MDFQSGDIVDILPNSIAIIDSFHVISWLNHSIIIYLNGLKKKFQDIDRKNYVEILRKRIKHHLMTCSVKTS